MALPIRTTVDDVDVVCRYLSTKPTGATLQEARAVIDPRYLDGRKLSALKFWGLIDEQEGKYRISERGRAVIKNGEAGRASSLTEVVQSIPAYRAIIERAAHRKEEALSATEVAAHWHDHFRSEASDNEKILNDQAVCFFQIAAGAQLGTLTVGRKGAPTRFEFNLEKIQAFIGMEASLPRIEDEEQPSGDTAEKRTAGANTPRDVASQTINQGIFVAHGKNKTPLDQLKKILEQFKIPYKVAVEEPNLGRPISAKVRDTMTACNCAILLFTADEEFKDKDGKSIWRPSENVTYELGAAGFLYDNRIVIMKEDSVEFPANFRDIGYISFSKDQLAAKAMEILKELIGFGIVKVTT